jgi:flagellin-like hook-associated protein FlgL
VQSSLEDTDIAKVTSQFSLSQTALQAAYQTTTRLEQEDLFSYLGNGS